MLDDIIRTKNIFPSIILVLIVVVLTGYYNQIEISKIICAISICTLILFYNKISSLIRSLFIVNILFTSSLVLVDFHTINNSILMAKFIILLAFLAERYFYMINGRFIFIEVTLLVFLALLCYPPTIFYILFIYCLILFHSIKKFSTWVLPLFCLFIFTMVAFGISFLLDFNLLNYLQNQLSHFQLVYYDFTPKQLYLLISLIFFSILALVDHYRIGFKQSTHNKKNYELILYLLIISSLLFLLSKNAILFVIFPCSIMISKYIFYRKNKWIRWFMILYFPVSALIWSVI
ncbi:MAG: DUF6427 family protein [Flavobacteriales bacterium]